MTLWSRLRSWLQTILQRSRMESELDAELGFHMDAYAEDLMRGGVPRDEAQRRARLEFGGIENAKEECREARGVHFVETLLQDFRYGARTMLRSPGFTVTAVLALALGIGANTAIFTAFDALVLRPLPVKDPDTLAALVRVTPAGRDTRFSYPDYVYYRDHNRSFSELSLLAFGMALTSSDMPVSSPQGASRVAGAIGFHLPELLQGSAQPILSSFVSGNYFPMLGATPLFGRILSPDDDKPNSPPVVMMSGNFWQQQFHSDPKVVGSVLHLNGMAFVVIGVTPVDYIGTATAVPALWAPVAAKVQLGLLSPQDLENRAMIAGLPMGRLKAGVTFSDAQAELGVLSEQLRTQYPEAERNMSVSVVSGRNNLATLDSDAWPAVIAAMAAVALLLLIACANVASLLLARAFERRKEIAVRLALGAGRWRLLRQLLTESMLLGILAGALGLPMAGWALRLLILEVVSSMPSVWIAVALRITPDIRIFTFTLVVSCAAGIAFGLAPALQASKSDVNSALKEDGTAFGQRLSRSRLRGVLIAGQMAACLVLLLSSALLLRGSQRALDVDPGYENKHVLYLEMYNPANLHYSQARLLQLNRDLVDGIGGIPGVLSVAQASRSPIGGNRWVTLAPVDATNLADEREPQGAGYSYVTPNYFDTLSIPIVRGRPFTMRETEGPSPVVVISEATARRFWPGENPIGKMLKIGSERGSMSYPGEQDPFIASSEVIGVARDIRSMDFRKLAESYVYLPLSQAHRRTSTLLVRTGDDPARWLPAIGQEVRHVDANLPVIAAPLFTMISLNPFFVVSRVGGLLASIIGALGLVMACMGVYGIVSYSVARRTHEIGIRMALGAQSVQVLKLVLHEGFKPILAGLIVGVFVSAGVARLLAATLFGLNPLDAVSFIGASMLLSSVALLATYLPARRAMRVDPMVALRYE